MNVLSTGFCAMIISAGLFFANFSPAMAEEQSIQESLTPQEYFTDRIRMESGQPAVASIPELYDELDFQRAVQAYVWATPFVALSEMLDSLERDFGASLTRQPIFEQSERPSTPCLPQMTPQFIPLATST